MKELEMVNVVELIPDKEWKELEKRKDLFVWYCPDVDMTYILRIARDENQEILRPEPSATSTGGGEPTS